MLFDNSVIATRHLDTVAVTDLIAAGIFAGGLLQKYRIPFSNMLSITSDTGKNSPN